MVKIKRIYEAPGADDGYRVLVDRLWPRGVAKDKAHIDLWLKEVGPSNELRNWFGHDPAKWGGFQTKYRAELAKNPVVEELQEAIRKNKTVTLLYSAKDEQHNQAVVLRDYLS